MIKKKKREVGEINSSSMADIAFLLLIFFLLTTTVDPAQGVTMLLPPYESDPLTKPPDEIVKVQVRSDGKVLFNGKKINLNQIMQQARNEIITFQAIKGAEKQPIFKLITAEKAEFQLYLQIVDQLKAAKCTKISVVWE